MGVEYFLVDTNRKEYFELGKMYDHEDVLDILLTSKKQHKPYDYVKKKLIEYSGNDIDEELEYDNFYINVFMKAIYVWIDPISYECVGDYTFYDGDYDNYKQLGSVFMEDNDVNSLCTPIYNFSQALSEMRNGKRIARKSCVNKVYSYDGQNLYSCIEKESDKLKTTTMKVEDILADDWIILSEEES